MEILNPPKRIQLKKKVSEKSSLILVDFLHEETKLSKSLLKKVLINGCVWVRLNQKSKLKKVRKATFSLEIDSYVEFYYDENFLNAPSDLGHEIYSSKEWGVWHKPAGVLSQFEGEIPKLGTSNKFTLGVTNFVVLGSTSSQLSDIVGKEEANQVIADFESYKSTNVLSELLKEKINVAKMVDSTLNDELALEEVVTRASEF